MHYATCEGIIACKSGGIGFVLDNSNDYDVIDDNGNLKYWAAEVVQTMNSDTELSPSGHDLHIGFTLSVPYSELCTRNANHSARLNLSLKEHRNSKSFALSVSLLPLLKAQQKAFLVALRKQIRSYGRYFSTARAVTLSGHSITATLRAMVLLVKLICACATL